jgi:hypothetical protein
MTDASVIPSADKPRGWWHEQASELLAQGWSARRIARHFDLSESVVYWFASETAREKTRQRVRGRRAERAGVAAVALALGVRP